MKQTQYEDYKYVIQDITHVYIGAKYTYAELAQSDEAPFKLRAILSQYMLKETSAQQTIEEHILQMKNTDLSYMVYKQLKTKCKVYEWQEADGGKIKKSRYVSKVYDIDGILQLTGSVLQEHPPVIEEIHFKKLSMMAVSL